MHTNILKTSAEFVRAIARRVSANSRATKHTFFLCEMHPSENSTIVDIGVNSTEYSDLDNYLEKKYRHQSRITALTIDDPEPLKARYPQLRVVRGDGRCLPFSTDEFDIAYSNAVIEHVGNIVSQSEFLSEAVRVAKAGFITTPNKYFPIETHTKLPLLHLLPKPIFDWILRQIGMRWAAGDYMNLLTRRDLEQLAREVGLIDYRICKTYFLGFAMTYILIWNKANQGMEAKQS